MISQWFPNVTDLFISFINSYSPESSPWVVDLAKVTKLSLYLAISSSLTPLSSGCLVGLLEQTGNIHSLVVYGESMIERDTLCVEEICSTIIRHVDRSKLRHLEIPVSSLNQVQMLFDRFRDLFSIRFFPRIGSISSEQIIVFVKALMPACSIVKEDSVVSIWIEERATSSVCPSSQAIEPFVE